MCLYIQDATVHMRHDLGIQEVNKWSSLLLWKASKFFSGFHGWDTGLIFLLLVLCPFNSPQQKNSQTCSARKYWEFCQISPFVFSYTYFILGSNLGLLNFYFHYHLSLLYNSLLWYYLNEMFPNSKLGALPVDNFSKNFLWNKWQWLCLRSIEMQEGECLLFILYLSIRIIYSRGLYDLYNWKTYWKNKASVSTMTNAIFTDFT
jgi:hypothetical protein